MSFLAIFKTLNCYLYNLLLTNLVKLSKMSIDKDLLSHVQEKRNYRNL